MQKTAYEQRFLVILIAALCIGAATGIYVLLSDDFGNMELKITLTTLALIGYSLSGLCVSSLYEKERYRVFALAGIATAVSGYLLNLLAVWETIDIDHTREY
ncbi:hypothetical protein [Sinomicrobium oceani]|nr:hypothetical protein [Sinomicrobium oceani]